jgi:hypothetical protein
MIKDNDKKNGTKEYKKNKNRFKLYFIHYINWIVNEQHEKKKK